MEVSAGKQDYYRWVMVFIGGLMGCVAIGAMFSLAVSQDAIVVATGWGHTGVSTAMTIDFLCMGVGGFFWGAMRDRFGPKPVALLGSLMLASGYFVAAHAPNLLAFQLAYGLIVGFGSGAILAPMIANITGWFDTHRGLAVSLVSAGMGMAPMVISPFVRDYLTDHDWRATLQMLSILCVSILVPAALFIRRAPFEGGLAEGGLAEVGAQSVTQNIAAPPAKLDFKQAFLSPQFMVLAATYFLCCAAHSGPIFHTVSYAQFCGIAPMAAVSIYSLEGLSGMAGRLIFGLGADKFGAKRMIVVGLLLQGIGIGAYGFAGSLNQFYMVAIMLGLAYGGVMPLYAVLAREYFGQTHMGAIMGAAMMISSVGMSLGPIGGGMIADHFGSLRLLYFIAAALSVAGMGIAISFPRKNIMGQAAMV